MLPFSRSSELPMFIMAILGGVLIWKHGKQATWQGGAKTFSLLFLCIWVPMALSVPDSLWFKKSLSTMFSYPRIYLAGIYLIWVLREDLARQRLLKLAAWLLLFWVVDALVQAAVGYDLLGYAYPDRLNGLFGPKNWKLGLTNWGNTRTTEADDRSRRVPLLLHIMRIYSHFGFNDFVVCLGYMGYFIKEYFSNYRLHRANMEYDFAAGTVRFFDSVADPWRVSLIDTGLDTMTGGRLRRVRPYLGDDTFMLTYGDGVADIDLAALLHFNKSHGRAATITAVQPPSRFGALDLDQAGSVGAFREKPQEEGGWNNGGFFVLEPSVFDLLEDDRTIWEGEPLERLAASGQLMAYIQHGGHGGHGGKQP